MSQWPKASVFTLLVVIQATKNIIKHKVFEGDLFENTVQTFFDFLQEPSSVAEVFLGHSREIPKKTEAKKRKRKNLPNLRF